MRLLQVEFYGILSPKVKGIHSKAGQEFVDYPPVKRGTDEYVDLLLRSRLHGYATFDPNDVRAELEEQAIPLKSIRIPLQPGLSAAWAPNGYGKTYIFNHLNAMNQYAIDGNYPAGLERYKNHYIQAQLNLTDENSSNPTPIVPYHALGLVLQNAGSNFAVVVIDLRHSIDFGIFWMEENMSIQGCFPIPSLNLVPVIKGNAEQGQGNSSVNLAWEIKAQIIQHQGCEVKLSRIRTGAGVNPRAGYKCEDVSRVRFGRAVRTRSRHAMVSRDDHRPVCGYKAQ